MQKGYLSLVLHAHLPFVRHPEHENFLEELWLFEAISETYLPLLRVFRSLEEDDVPFRITFSLSPTLMAMLLDPLLQDRYLAHLDKLIELGDREIERLAHDQEFRDIAKMYRDLYSENRKDFVELYQKNIIKGFHLFQKSGHLELITTSATHAFLPTYSMFPKAVEAQVQVAVNLHEQVFGRPPKGFWVPECGYYPGLENILANNGVKYFFAAAHGVLFADDVPRSGVYAPIRCPNGTAVFGRDLPSSNAVWSAEEGYPGDICYREFYRDIGWDLPVDYIGPWIHNGSIRINTGYKYYAITGKTDEKKPYKPADAERKVREHAENFIYNRLHQIRKLAPHMDKPPVIVSPYDAELFGHWWFEGPKWIDALVRGIQEYRDEIEMISPWDYLERHGEGCQKTTPSFSSWGNKGYGEVWIDGSNDWIYPHLHRLVIRMEELAERFPDEHGLKARALNQAAREVLLSQASDWPFIMKTGTTVPYAVRRVKDHINNFMLIYENLCRNSVNTEWLTRIEKKNNLFPGIDYRMFSH